MREDKKREVFQSSGFRMSDCEEEDKSEGHNEETKSSDPFTISADVTDIQQAAIPGVDPKVAFYEAKQKFLGEIEERKTSKK